MNCSLFLFVSSLFLCSAQFGSLFGSQFGNNQFSTANFAKFFPKEWMDTYTNLTPQEQKTMKEVFQNYRNYQNEHEFLNAIKQKSPSLGIRMEQKMMEYQRKVAGLSDEAREFVNNLMATLRQIYSEHLNGGNKQNMRQMAMGIAQHYRSLSPFAQEELKQTFPEIFEAMAHARAQMMQRFFPGGMGK